MENNKVLIVLVGIPCSGKSTWIEQHTDALIEKFNAPVIVISRDEIREELFGKIYKQNNDDEKKVTNKFYKLLASAITLDNVVIVLDNTHLRASTINEYLYMFKSQIESGKMKFFIKRFEISYWKAYIRNWVRRWKTGKWIPIKVLKDFNKRSKKLNLENLKKHFYE